MADERHSTNGQASDFKGVDTHIIPHCDRNFLSERHLNSFKTALGAPDSLSPLNAHEWGSGDGDPSFNSKVGETHPKGRKGLFITAQHDWAPVRPIKFKIRGRRKQGQLERRIPQRSSDETREGHLYSILKWPLLAIIFAWILVLSIGYLSTRLYVWLYEYHIAWRGQRKDLRKKLRSATNYADWVTAAKELDEYLGNDHWKKIDKYAYYDQKTIKRALEEIRRCRKKFEYLSGQRSFNSEIEAALQELKATIEPCMKNNFVGIENPMLYSETYYGTKNLIQEFIDEVEKGYSILASTAHLDIEEKRYLFKRIQKNYGRTALCLSGGASFSYYHFGVVKALLDADLLPNIISGTSGGALIAALVATHTNEELKNLLVPALASKINACAEPFGVWFPRWWKTGARFDSVDWARKCSWFTRGSMTFREAYERTGRILNISCIPAEPHSPTILTNYLTSPDCVIWSAVLASAAVPGILNPVVLMMKTANEDLIPFSFGHKWKDGSLRTDIPITALNLHFNVNFSIVSQVNPHINLFFFSSRGAVGQPVTHRKGRGWRGGFLGSAAEQYLKLDLSKWLRVIRALELLPRPFGQDWSEVWLQKFSGNITIWPRTIPLDFWRILSDPDPEHLARMMHIGQQSTFPKLQFIANRLKLERIIEHARQTTRIRLHSDSIQSVISEQDMRRLLRRSESISSGENKEVTEDDDLSSGSEEKSRKEW
ncbi:Patatin-like phospholipase domain-containing protein [Podosphaera aphanis]|nr:Patatin-like phospholipase domain-containing protein [Podosphaera aphanis]